MIARLIRVVTPQPGGHAGSRDKLNNYISTCRKPMDKKLGKVMAYNKTLPSLNSHDSFIT